MLFLIHRLGLSSNIFCLLFCPGNLILFTCCQQSASPSYETDCPIEHWRILVMHTRKSVSIWYEICWAKNRGGVVRKRFRRCSAVVMFKNLLGLCSSLLLTFVFVFKHISCSRLYSNIGDIFAPFILQHFIVVSSIQASCLFRDILPK